MADTPCSLTGRAWEERVQDWQSVSDALVHRAPTAEGAELVYRLDPSVAATLARLMEAERHCCASVSFEATVVVRVQAPPSMRPWVEQTFLHEPRPLLP